MVIAFRKYVTSLGLWTPKDTDAVSIWKCNRQTYQCIGLMGVGAGNGKNVVSETGSAQKRERQDQTRPGQELTCRSSSTFFSSHQYYVLEKIKKVVKDECPHQTLDGRFGDGKSEAHGKYSAKEGVRPHQARPQTNIQVCFLLNDSNLKPNTFSRHLTESLVMERVRHMGSTARRRVWDQTKQDLRRTYRCLLLRTFHLNVNCLFSLLGEQRERVRLKTGKRIICEINWKDLHRQRYKLKLSDKTQVQCKRGCYKTGSS